MESLIELQIRLYGLPEWDFEVPLTLEKIVVRGNYLREHLIRVTEMVSLLFANGWDLDPEILRTNCVLTKFISRDNLFAELTALRIRPDEIQLYDMERTEQILWAE